MSKFTSNTPEKITEQYTPATPVRERVVLILQVHNQETGQGKVNYALNLFEPRSPDERNRYEIRRDKDMIYKVEIDPYANRIEYLLGKYFKLPSKDRSVIREARAENVFWRGEDINQLLFIWDETLRMRDIGLEEYRAKAIKQMRALFGGLQ